MGEPNVKLIKFDSNRDCIYYGIEEFYPSITWEEIKRAGKVSIEFDFRSGRGSIYIVPKGPIFDPSILP